MWSARRKSWGGFVVDMALSCAEGEVGGARKGSTEALRSSTAPSVGDDRPEPRTARRPALECGLGGGGRLGSRSASGME